jgi:hypothetical protein
MHTLTSQTLGWNHERLKRPCGTLHVSNARVARPAGWRTLEKLRPSEGRARRGGQKKLFRIIETADNLVNTETVRKYPGLTVDKVPPRRKTLRKNFVPVSARENQTAATPNASNARMALKRRSRGPAGPA